MPQPNTRLVFPHSLPDPQSSLQVSGCGDETESIKIAGEELYIGEVEDMADAILLGREPRVSLHDSRNNIAAILALLESARTHQPVLL